MNNTGYKNNSSNSNSNNNSNNNNFHEIIFWKVFRNIYIRNKILYSIINNNNNKSNYSYNGTTSLKLMKENNKLHMMLDKLKSNHYIHIDSMPIWDQKRYKVKDPCFRLFTNQLNQLLLLYKSYIRSYTLKELDVFKYQNEDSIIILERYKLCYPDNKNNYNSYMAHGLLYKLFQLNYHNNNIKTIQYLIQQINNNKEYINIINNSYNDKKEYFIQQLISKSSSTSSSSTLSTLENEVIEAIYNDQPIPTHINHYYSIEINNIVYNNYTQDLYDNQLKLDICSILLNKSQKLTIINCKKELLEFILLKLLYHHQFTIEFGDTNKRITDYPVNSILHAQIYCLNQLNSWVFKEMVSVLKFKKHLINNQVNTLDELISVAKNSFKELDYEQCFGHYYYYHIASSNQLDSYTFKTQEFSFLSLNYSMITQQTELFDRHYKVLGTFLIDYVKIISLRNSIGIDINNNSNDQSIKDNSTKYFNHIIKELKDYTKDKSGNSIYWFNLLILVICSYNFKLFKWLLESNKELNNIYYKLMNLGPLFPRFFKEYTNIYLNSDQVDYEMLDFIINHFKIIKFPEYPKIDSKIVSDTLFYVKSQGKVKIFNHLIKSSSNGNDLLIHQIVKILFGSFKELESADDIIKIYNQIDQQLLFKYYSSINQNQYNYSKQDISTNQNKSSVLVPLLIQSIIDLDFNSINKIISATINNSINNNDISIPTTFNNSIDIIKYLISQQYLKEFSLYYILEEIISNIQVDKEFIIEFIRLSNNNEINNTTTSTTAKNEKNSEITEDKLMVEEFIVKYEQIHNEIEQKRNDQLKIEIERNQIFSLSTLERIKYEYKNTKNYRFLNDTELKNCIGESVIDNAIGLYYSKGYYNTIYQFLNNNNDIKCRLENLNTNSISIEWYSKLYPVLFKDVLLYSNSEISHHCDQNPPEIFEFIWNTHFKNNNERIEYIRDLLLNDNYQYCSYAQLTEYIFKTKREFIIKSVKLDKPQLKQLHKFCLYRFDKIHLFSQVRMTFPSYNFKITHKIINRLFQEDRYEAIETLFENNLIPNLEQIIGTTNLNNFRIKEYNNNPGKMHMYISKSMFILIHTIIKLQKQKQQQQQQNRLVKISLPRKFRLPPCLSKFLFILFLITTIIIITIETKMLINSNIIITNNK